MYGGGFEDRGEIESDFSDKCWHQACLILEPENILICCRLWKLFWWPSLNGLISDGVFSPPHNRPDIRRKAIHNWPLNCQRKCLSFKSCIYFCTLYVHLIYASAFIYSGLEFVLPDWNHSAWCWFKRTVLVAQFEPQVLSSMVFPSCWQTSMLETILCITTQDRLEQRNDLPFIKLNFFCFVYIWQFV